MARADIKLTTDMDSSKLQAGLARSRAGIKRFAGFAMGQFAMLAGAMGFAGLARSAVEFGSTQSDIASQLNINTTAFQTLNGAMKDAGGSNTQMQKSIANMSKAIIQGGEGLSTFVRAFDRIGISADEFKGKSTTEQFNMIAKAVAGAEDQQSAFTSVMEVFGTKNAPQLIEVMKRVNSEGFEAMSEQIEDTYGIMDKETQTKLDIVADKMGQFKNKAIVVFGELLVKSFPYIEMLGMGLKHLGVTFVGWFKVAKTNMEGVAKVAMAIFEPMIKQFQGFGQVLASFKDIGNPKKMFEGMKKGAETYVEGVKDALDFKSTFEVIKGAVKDSSEVFVKEFDKIADSGEKTLDDIKNKYNKIGKEIDSTTGKAGNLNNQIGGTGGSGTNATGGTGGSKGSKGGKVSSSKDSSRFDEADLNESGATTAREQREFERQQKKIKRANDKLRQAEMAIETEFGSLENAQSKEDPRFGSPDKPFSRGGRLAKNFLDAQNEVRANDPNSPLNDSVGGSALDKSKKGGGADGAEASSTESETNKILEEIKAFNETTDTNISEIKDLMDKIDTALT
jgi:hypothetical protein